MSVLAFRSPARADQVHKIGVQTMQAVTGTLMPGILARIAEHSPQLAQNMVGHAFGAVVGETTLGLLERELETIAMLGAVGGCEAQLRAHVGFALDCGVAPEEIIASVEQVSVYSGYPRALTMLAIAREVLAERGSAILTATPFTLRDHTTRLFDSGGDGPPLLLLHALGLDWRMWSRVIPQLTPHFRVLAYDLRGFGGAAGAPTVRDLAQYAEDARDLLDRLGLDTLEIAGLSLGGSISLELALACPERFTRLSIIAATAWSFPAFEERARAAETEGMEAQVIPSLTRWFRRQDLAVNAWPVRYARNCVRRAFVPDWSAAWRTLAGIDLERRHKALSVPINILAGACDQSTPPKLMEGLVEGPGRRFGVIADAPHLLALTHPRELAGALMP